MDDFQDNGGVDVNLDDDDDDMFKSARGLEPEPEKRDVNLFGSVNSGTDLVSPGNTSPDMTVDREIALEDEDEKPFQVNDVYSRQNRVTNNCVVLFILITLS